MCRPELFENIVLLERPGNNKGNARSLLLFDMLKVKSIQESLAGRKNLRNVIQDFPVLLTFSFKAYKHVLLLN